MISEPEMIIMSLSADGLGELVELRTDLEFSAVMEKLISNEGIQNFFIKESKLHHVRTARFRKSFLGASAERFGEFTRQYMPAA